MKNIILIYLFFAISVFALAQTNADLVGEWYNAKDDIEMTLFKEGPMVSGKITWMKLPNDKNGNPKIDLLNPDESLRTNEILGMMIMSNFSHIAANIWDNGTLYVPEKGKSFSGIMRLKDDNTLNVRGYVGFSFFERYSTTWTRVLDRYELVGKLNLLSQLKEDLMVIIKLIENISLKPAEEILQKIEKENLLIKLQLDLSKLIKKIEKIKKAES
tara:strand:+ start:339 stop:983 length:645 start_codon:yes stop_codon:yes gene_type:complete